MSSAGAEPACDPFEDERISLMKRIQDQQQELEDSRERLASQEDQIRRLTDMNDSLTPRVTPNASHASDEEKSRLEARVAELEDVSRQAFNMRCAITDLATKMKDRDLQLIKCREQCQTWKAEYTHQQEESIRWEETARMCLADMDGYIERSLEVSASAKLPSEEVRGTGNSYSMVTEELYVDVETHNEVLKKVEELEFQLGKLSAEKKRLESKSTRELLDLRKMLSEVRLDRGVSQSSNEDSPSKGPEYFDIAAKDSKTPPESALDADDCASVGPFVQVNDLLFQQRISDLEQDVENLKAELVLAKDTETVLREDVMSKSLMLSRLLDNGSPSSVSFGPVVDGFLRSITGRSHESPQARILEEAMLDNVRLRNDIQRMANVIRQLQKEEEIVARKEG